MADSEFEEFRRVFDRLPQHIKAPTPFYSLVPNVGLDDESPSSKSECSPEEDIKEDIHACMVDGNATTTTIKDDVVSPPPQPNITETQRSPQHYSFTIGERKRRKLPEIPKNRKSKILACSQPASLADELGALTGLLLRPGCQTRPLLVLKCGYLLEEDSSPDSERLQSLGDVDSGHSTAHSPIDTGPKSISPTLLQQNVSPASSCSITRSNFAGNMTNIPHSQLEMLEATHRGLHKFNPRHHDEIEVEIGDPIYVQKEAEDLWCEGVNLRTGQQGIFPSAYAVDMDYNDFDPANAKDKKERYLLAYMGSVETSAHKGTGVVCQAVRKIVSECNGEPTMQPCILEVSDHGLRMVDRSKPARNRNGPCIDYFYSLKNVSFCAFHPRDHRYLGFITKHPTLQRFACHVFRGQESTRPVAEAVGYLEVNGRLSIFNNKLPGKKWAFTFLKRNKSDLTYRVIQNIKRSRAEKSPEEMLGYFKNLKISLEGISNENILNYDETNLTDNPGAQKCLFRRGVKYPERVLNYTKGAISIMFAITAGGECLAPYVVYKAEHLYTQWTLNGPKGSRFNRSKSGWFDSVLFEDWFESIILPWAKTKTGKKVLIGDNLASHINHKIVTYCEENDIRFVFLPPNSSHLTQPLDVCYFGPLKKLWREILLHYKIKNPREATIHKGHFPDLLKKLMDQLNEKTHNIISAFKCTGIAPLNPDKVISKLPGSNHKVMPYTIDNALLDWLKEIRSPDPNKKIRNKKLNVLPGKSVSSSDFEDVSSQPKKGKAIKNNKRLEENDPETMQPNSALLLQSKSSVMLKAPDSLNNLCIRSINTYMQNTEESSSQLSTVHCLSKISRNDQANMTFINKIPECLQTKKTKIVITSDVTIKAGPSQKNLQSKQGNTNLKMKGVRISRSALHMELFPIKKEMVANTRKALEEITQEIKEDVAGMKRKIISKETRKKKLQKTYKPIKQKKKRSDSESSIEMSVADTDDSEYETLDEFIRHYQQEEQENVEPSISYGMSDIEYVTENGNKFKTDSWILAKFVTKKSVKHFVGKVISMKDDVPEVKFVRKVKESKFKKGSVFTYPTIDDICAMKHLDDIVKVLPEPNISRRGHIIFNIDLSNYNISFISLA